MSLFGKRAELLVRTMGEDVQVELRLHPLFLAVHADRSMLDQVLLNLAINVRDAMPNGGNLSIETRAVEVREGVDVPPGRYALLSVSDSGTGMDAEALSRLFEPFFTTKEAGKGTGLGLATVFGIVKQHQGSISVQSKVGHGTTFTILLPASPDLPEALARPATREPGRLGTETVLVVEDEPAVRDLAVKVLDQQGYRVLSAASAVEALALWPKHAANVALLITDLLLPEGIGGAELAARLTSERPDLKVIFTSGYHTDRSSDGAHPQDAQFLRKPFSCGELLGTVRSSLERSEAIRCADVPA